MKICGFFYRILWIFPVFLQKIQEGDHDVESVFVDVVLIQRHVNQWPVLKWYKWKLHAR